MPGSFDGNTTTWDAFMNRFKNCSAYKAWTETGGLAHLVKSLRGSAEHILWADPGKVWKYDGLMSVLNKRFGTGGQSAYYKTLVARRRRAVGESLSSLQQDLIKLMALAYEGPRSPHTEAFTVEAFYTALDDTDLAEKIREL